MAEITELVSDVAFVEADMNYIIDDGIPPVRYVDWPEEEHKAHRPAYESRRMRIEIGRTCGEDFTLPSHGFRLLAHKTAVENFYDEDDVDKKPGPRGSQRLYRTLRAAAGA
jgi:hypothetical protein